MLGDSKTKGEPAEPVLRMLEALLTAGSTSELREALMEAMGGKPPPPAPRKRR